MDAFTPGMFGELQSYEDRAEFEAWLDSIDGVIPVESPKDKVARLFEEKQQAKTKQEQERIWMEQQRIYG